MVSHGDKLLLKECWEYFRKLNRDIGRFWWKYYISSAFWNHVSIPINFSITMITAVTTGESASKSLLDSQTALYLGVTALILSTINTFFSPEKNLGETKEYMKTWERRGIELEKIRMLDISNTDKISKSLKEYKKLFDKVNEIKRQQSNNFLTDGLYFTVRMTCMRACSVDGRWVKSRFLKKWERDQESFSEYDGIIGPEEDECCWSLTCLYNKLFRRKSSHVELSNKFNNYMKERVWMDFEEEFFDIESGERAVRMPGHSPGHSPGDSPVRRQRRSSLCTIYSENNNDGEDVIDMDENL